MLKRNSLVTTAFAAAFVAGMALPATSKADPLHDDYLDETHPSSLAMIGDALIARPLLIVGTAVGAGIFVVTSPFTAGGGNIGDAWDMWVVTPAKNAFQRCLGCTPIQDQNLRTDRRVAKSRTDADTPVPERSN